MFSVSPHSLSQHTEVISGGGCMQSTMGCILSMNTHTHTHTHKHMYTHTHTRMHAHTQTECSVYTRVIGLRIWASSQAFHCSTPLHSTNTCLTHTGVYITCARTCVVHYKCSQTQKLLFWMTCTYTWEYTLLQTWAKSVHTVLASDGLVWVCTVYMCIVCLGCLSLPPTPRKRVCYPCTHPCIRGKELHAIWCQLHRVCMDSDSNLDMMSVSCSAEYDINTAYHTTGETPSH